MLISIIKCSQVSEARRNSEGWKSIRATKARKTTATCTKRIRVSEAQKIEVRRRGFRAIKSHWPWCFWRGVWSLISLFYIFNRYDLYVANYLIYWLVLFFLNIESKVIIILFYSQNHNFIYKLYSVITDTMVRITIMLLNNLSIKY